MSMDAATRDEMLRVVGAENLLETPEDRDRYARPAGRPVLLDPKVPDAVATPRSLEQVQEVVAVLNQRNVPVVPFSSGLDYQGNAVPLVEGTVVLDLSNMKEISWLCPTPEEGMFAVVEPGVTFAELQRELDQHGVRVPMPARHPAEASVVSTYANKRPSYRSSWQGLYTFPMMMPTIELVTSDGGTYRSGAYTAEIPTIPQVGMGLDRQPFGSLGSSGIITKGTVILEKKPAVRRILFAQFDEFGPAARAMQKVLRYSSTEIGETHVLVNDVCLAGLLSGSPDEFEVTKRQLAPWTYALCISGRDESWLRVLEKDLADIATQLRLEFLPELEDLEEAAEALLDEFAMPWRVGRVFEYAPHNRVEFNTSLSRIPKYDELIAEAVARHEHTGEIGIFVLPIEQARTCFVGYDLFFDWSAPRECERMRSLLDALYPRLIDAGAFFVNSDHPVVNRLLRQEAPDYYGMIDKVKQLYDPNNIFNPGRVFP